MKKLICVVALCLTSSLVFAGEEDIQKVLDSVHSKGFVGCDEQIRQSFEHNTIIHVETKMPFQTGKGRDVDDEVIVIVDLPENAQQGIDEGITSYIFRKVGTECLAARNIRVLTDARHNCGKVAQMNYGVPILVAQTDSASWMRRSMLDMSLESEERGKFKGAQAVFTPVTGGGCRQIDLPYDWSKNRKQ